MVDGKVLIEDITELLYIKIEDENIDTIGGWAYIQLDSYPQVNDKFTYKNYEFIILKCDRKRINKLLIKDLSDK
ncbi:transporter associated domain-containing protein [Paeniclostridium hominis]|uniref:transporter associated domain-containing protein n=1 Tax=Paeniclostridium hominis TaxID=2764329 RepID=UPI002FE6EC2D